MTAVYVEALPPTKTDPHPGIRWAPGLVPGCGTLTVVGRRTDCEYVVTELPPGRGWEGRGFAFLKTAGQAGSDAEADRYAVFVGRGGVRQCDCKGFARWGHCKHADAAAALVENRWLDLPPTA